jgi:hypothetical protein
MNDSTNLSYYSQLLVFQDITFREPSRPQQQVLHSLALKFGFEYEYSRISRTVMISQSVVAIVFSDIFSAVLRAFDITQ